MNFVDPSMALLAACGGDTVKLFDVSVEPDRDPCTLSYSPTPRSQVNSLKWNHTNLVVASAGDDKKISLWQKNGQSLGTIPPLGVDSGDNIDESISAISFSNKGSRYICSGGSGQVVRIWDLQRKRCIKWLRGHTDTITGVMYNCKDDQLASTSLKGDIILHNLASGTKVASQLKDPNGQVLRVLDYSRSNRHLLVTAGDDGSVHLWDTSGRSPMIPWLKQHSAPTTGVSFSPSNDKIIASVGLDKKLYTFDSGMKRPPTCYSYEAPFTSLAFRDDGWILAAGTNNGQVVFYDVRAKRDPITALRAYNNSEAVTSLCWQRLKPIIVNENNCTAETALLGGAGEDSILMPDPLPSMTSSTLSSVTAPFGSRNPTRLGLSGDASSLTTINGGSISNNQFLPAGEETPHRNLTYTGRPLARLQASHTGFDLKDEMEVFSPLVDVQPITPSFDKDWNSHNETRKESLSVDKKPTSLLFPSSMRFPFTEEDETRSSSTQLGNTPASSQSEESFSSTPPEAWGGESFRQPGTFSSRFGMMKSGGLTSGSTGSGLLDASTSTSQSSSLSTAGLSYTNMRNKDISNQETSLGLAEHVRFSSRTSSLGTKSITGQHLESPGSPLALPRRYSTYADRISTTSSFSDGAALASGSPKSKKTGTETREELLNGLTSQPQRDTCSPDLQQGTSSFATQLIERILEEKLTSVQKSNHEDMRNLHIELIRQFHMQETEISTFKSSVVEMLAELMKEFQALRKENQQLRQLL